MNIITKFFNCNILKDGKILAQDIWVEDGQIANPEMIFYDQKKIPDIEIDCLGSLIAPGFLDLQINGQYKVKLRSYNKPNIMFNLLSHFYFLI